MEKYEDEYLSLLSERLEMITSRRRDDDEDDLSLFFYIPQKPAETEDEFGRSVVQGPRDPSREARRASRSARVITSSRPPSLTSGPLAKLGLTPDDEQGYTTDSDLPPADLEDFTLAMARLNQKISTLLDDVKSVEFKDPTKGLAKRFAHWRDTWGDSYTGAWGGLGMIGAWEFWARLEMIEWNPLEVRMQTIWPYHLCSFRFSIISGRPTSRLLPLVRGSL